MIFVMQYKVIAFVWLSVCIHRHLCTCLHAFVLLYVLYTITVIYYHYHFVVINVPCPHSEIVDDIL